MKWNEMKCYSFFNRRREMKTNEIVLHDWPCNEVKWSEIPGEEIPGSAEADWALHCRCGLNHTCLLVSIHISLSLPSTSPCSWMPQKNEDTQLTNSFIRTHQILISQRNEMKWNELYGLQLQMNWNEMKCYSFFNSGCEMKINEWNSWNSWTRHTQKWNSSNSWTRHTHRTTQRSRHLFFLVYDNVYKTI